MLDVEFDRLEEKSDGKVTFDLIRKLLDAGLPTVRIAQIVRAISLKAIANVYSKGIFVGEQTLSLAEIVGMIRHVQAMKAADEEFNPYYQTPYNLR